MAGQRARLSPFSALLGLVGLRASLVLELRFPFPKLPGQLVGHQVQGRMEVRSAFLGVNVWPANRKVSLDAKTLSRFCGFIVNQYQVSRDDFREILDLRDNPSRVMMHRC